MTSVDLANRALDIVGTQNIVAITDSSKEARICLRNQDLCRQATLRVHPWNFAITRVILSVVDPTPPAFDFANKFALPSDYLRLTKVDVDTDDWRIEKNFMLSDSTTIQIAYVQDVTNLSLWEPLAFDAFAHYLAWIICYSITQSQTLKDGIFKDWQKILSKAKQMDSIEDPKQDLDIDVWMRSRVGPSQGFVRDPMT